MRLIGRADCLRLLATVNLGRVVHTERAMPAAHPVTFLLQDEEVIFRTGSLTKATAASRGAVFAFQVDHVDFTSRTRWSVLGVGQAYLVAAAARLAELDGRLPPPWAPDYDGYTIAIALTQLSGRCVGPLS
ncbi:pyridoxamine 5'-phosphate oxidase family protein [Pseudonocardia sp. NPDC049154]|uniref:pyridoxamine 5'-phosphate oxidase family protein n=1 Tax=Pseudonocardia sp. NPDC049154 TaxID=3155501 RepID=UPI003408C9BB